jgi:hypothetical protein
MNHSSAKCGERNPQNFDDRKIAKEYDGIRNSPFV